MSNPLIVTDKSPKFLLGVQRDVMNSRRYVGGVDNTVWGSRLPTDRYAISGGSRNGEILDASDYSFSVSKEGVTIVLYSPLSDGRVILYPPIDGYTVTKLSDTVWRAELSISLVVVGGADDGCILNWEPITPLWQSISNSLSGLTADPIRASWSLVNGIPRMTASTAADTTHYCNPVPSGSSSGGTVFISMVARCNDINTISILVNGSTWPGSVPVLGQTFRSLICAVNTTDATVWNVPTGTSAKATRLDDGSVRIDVISNSTLAGNLDVRMAMASPSATLPLVPSSGLSWFFAGSSSTSVDVDRIIIASGGTARYGTTVADATLGPVYPDGSRFVSLAQGATSLAWNNPPTGYDIIKLDDLNYKIVYTGDIVDPILVEADLDAIVHADEMLELRGDLTVYNDLTISGKLYITQELGF